jgi:predicted metal-binding membrane protein
VRTPSPATAPATGGARRVDGLTLFVLGLALACALAIALWSASPYGRYLDHANQPDSAAGQLGALGLYVAGWTLMIGAMMLPSTVGLLRALGVVTRARPDRRQLLLLSGAGFVGVWAVVGYAFRGADVGVHAAVGASDWLEARPHLIGASALLVAGAFQFSSLKDRCLTACRSPASFLFRHWHGVNPVRDSIGVGAAYGASCVGCCWALMLVMFGLGTASVPWMLGLGAVMAVEKGSAAGRRLSAPLGVGLLAAGVIVAAGA